MVIFDPGMLYYPGPEPRIKSSIMTTSEVAKFNMIAQQIRPWEVLDPRVLSVLDDVDREAFVRDAYKGLAYADCQVPVADGVRMLPPTVEGRMLQALMVEPDDRVLEIGSGSGYVTACLARLGQHVTSLDTRADIIEFASANLAACGIGNVDFGERAIGEVDDDKAWDACQEAWIGIVKGLRKLDDPSAFAAWAYRIVTNKCKDRLTQEARDRWLNQEFAAGSAPGQPVTESMELREAIRLLPGHMQAVLTLRYFEGFALSEIAEILGVPEGTIKSRLNRARAELKRILEK